ncbi:MAG TPA: [protein-PII] uridylyltransferase, partial [Mycobacteriales bacterium]|nr:[protein-PII] uridylyltransferase [Mycobacteriales bacterium]
MVRHHLLLPDVATRRDLDDLATIESVADAVGSRDLLDLLAALAEADGLATGAAAWSEWKAGLIAELVRRVAATLDGSRTDPAPGLVERYADGFAAGGTSVTVAESLDLVVVMTRDVPGLLWRVAGALALHRLDVRSATVASAGGIAVQEIAVSPAPGSTPQVARVADDVRRALEGRLAIESRLAERARAYARPAAVPPEPPRLIVDNDASRDATVIEVRAADEVGVLYRIARALSDCALDVRSAKVSTLGHEVVDTFYVVEADGAKVTHALHLAEIERAVIDQLRTAAQQP